MSAEIIISLVLSFLSLVLSFLLIRATVFLGQRQNKLEEDSQKITLFEKRYEILTLLIEIIANVKILDNPLFKENNELNKTLFFVEMSLNGRISEKAIKEKTLENRKFDDLIQLLNLSKKQCQKLNRSKYLFIDVISSSIIDFANKYYNYVEACVSWVSKDDLENKENELKLTCEKIKKYNIINLIETELNLIKEQPQKEIKEPKSEKELQKEVEPEIKPEEVKEEVKLEEVKEEVRPEEIKPEEIKETVELEIKPEEKKEILEEVKEEVKAGVKEEVK